MTGGSRTMLRGVGSPAEAAERIGRAYPEQAAGQVQQIVKDFARKFGATVTHGRERRDVRGAEIADLWFDFGRPTEDDGQAEPAALVGEEDEPGAWSLVGRIVLPQLQIDLLDLDRYAEDVFGKPREETDGAPAKDRGGRPPVHDWTRPRRQVLARVYQHGLPPGKGELAAELWDWFARNFELIPELRTVERWIAELWPELVAMVHEPCELRPSKPGDET